MPISSPTIRRARDFGVDLRRFLIQTYGYVYLFTAGSIQFTELWAEPMRLNPEQGRRSRP